MIPSLSASFLSLEAFCFNAILSSGHHHHCHDDKILFCICMTRITQVCVLLVFVLIHNDLILIITGPQHSDCSNFSTMYKIKLSDPIKNRHLQDQGQNSSPYHDRPPNLTPHISTMTSFTNCNVYFTNDSSYLHQCSPSIWPHHHLRALYEVSSSISAEIHKRPVKIWASRIAFSPDQFTISFNLFSAHNSSFQPCFSILLSNWQL